MKNKNYQKLSLFLIVVAIALFGVSIFLFQNKDDNNNNPDYASKDVDENAVKIKVNGDKKSTNNGGSVSLNYSDRVYLDLKEKKAKILIENPENSNQNIVVKIEAAMDENDPEKYDPIAESNSVPPGYALYEVDLDNDVEFNEVEYAGRIIFNYYDEVTNEKAAVELNIPALIVVK